MPRIRRQRVLDAAPGAVWGVVGNPHHLARWWPKVTRVEDVADGRFTEVFTTAKGRTVRADFRVVDREEGRRIAWEQELEGTPFERVFSASRTELVLTPEGGGTRLAVAVDQRLAGMSRLGGGLMVRRGTGRILDEALDGLEDLLPANPG